ncbi:MAG: hypothetical protein KAT38_02810, partial [Bacteroidales bacterium]|nr:hypothetical protein [Bacteroidales bacterium]
MTQEKKGIRLSKAAREFNVGINTIVEFLHKKDIVIETNPNTKISPEAYEFLSIEYSSDSTAKKESEKLSMRNLQETQEGVLINETENDIESPDETEAAEEVLITDVSGTASEIEKPVDKKEEKTEDEPVSDEKPVKEKKSVKEKDIKVVGKIDLDSIISKTKPEKKPEKKPKKKKKVTPPRKEAPKKEEKEEPALDVETKEIKPAEEKIEKKVYKS